MFIEDTLDRSAHLDGIGCCLNLHEADAGSLDGYTFDFIAPVGGAVEVVPFTLVFEDRNRPTLLVSDQQIASLAIDSSMRFPGLPLRPHLLSPSPNTVHLGISMPYITGLTFWDRQRWRVFLPAFRPAFVSATTSGS